MKLYRGGYWHSSSEWYSLEIIAKNEKLAYKQARKMADGLMQISLSEIKDLRDLLSGRAYKFALQKGWISKPAK